MNYLALYRKYRPKTFEAVYGQQSIIRTLQNQVKANRIGHAYLFNGPRGTGKTSIAKIFSMAINCSNNINGSPCLQCESCKKTLQGLNIDITEIDAASNNGVDNVRELIEESKYIPQYGKYKVYIIDEVHMLSSSAFNALLKTLEEPYENTVFILATTEEYKVPKTITSRCQRYNFKLIDNDTIVNALNDILQKENVSYELNAIQHIAKLAKGGLRDALSLLDQILVYDTKITFNDVIELFGDIQSEEIKDIADKIKNNDVSNLLDIITNMKNNGKNLSLICTDLYEYYKDLYLYDDTVDKEIIQRYMRIFAELIEKMKYNNNYTLFEINMIKLCKPEMETNYDSLYQRISVLENELISLKKSGNIDLDIDNNYNETDTLMFYSYPKNTIIYNQEGD